MRKDEKIVAKRALAFCAIIASCAKPVEVPFALSCAGTTPSESTLRWKGKTQDWQENYVVDPVRQSLFSVVGNAKPYDWCSATTQCHVEIDGTEISATKTEVGGHNEAIKINWESGNMTGNLSDVQSVGGTIEFTTKKACDNVSMPTGS